MTISLSLRPALLPLALLSALAACADQPSPVAPSAPPDGPGDVTLQTLSCTADVRAGQMSCTDDEEGSPDASPDGPNRIILNPYGKYVRLITRNHNYASGVYTFDAAIQNLLVQTLSVTTNGYYDGSGVRAFFPQDPVTTVGTGTITVNGAESGSFTGDGQLFYRYPQTLATGQTSAFRRWSFSVPETVTRFTVSVLVAAKVQYPFGWIEIKHAPALTMERGASRTLGAVVRDAWGRDVTSSSAPVTWSITDASVAALNGSTLTGAAISGLSSVTATSGRLSATARLEVGAPFTQISAGGSHTCGLTSTRRIYCWGGNLDGQLGDNTVTRTRPFPRQVADDAEYVQVSAGYWHTCGLTAAGQARCWGSNRDGELGDGTTTGRKAPVPVQQGAMVFTSISAAVFSTCALTPAGQAWCWGRNAFGQLGDGTTQNRLVPVAVQQGGIPYDEIATGNNHTCGRASPRSAFCWGANESGQLGDSTLQPSLTPVRVRQGTARYVEMRAGENFTCARSGNGQSYCWGLGTRGQLGNGSSGSRLTPTPVLQRGTMYVQIAAAYDGVCGITAAGQGWCWGFSPTFLQQGSPRYVEIDAGRYHTCGRTAAGRLYCWGNDGGYDALGNPADGRIFPVPVLQAP